MTVSSLFLLAAVAVALAAFVTQRLRLGRVKLPPPLAPARGSAAAGVRYAFTTAFAPWAKESGRRHLPSYLGGIVYHLAVFAMLARLLTSPFSPALPRPLAAAAVILFALGLACGLALLVKRAVDPALRGLSVPDDFLANLLASGALAMGLAAVVKPAWLPFFQVMGGVLLLYAPLGKLRHMLFLITSRVFWGEFYGRRGVRPAPHPLAERNG